MYYLISMLNPLLILIPINIWYDFDHVLFFSWVKMDNESVLSGHTGHSEPPTSRLSKSNLNNLNNKVKPCHNNSGKYTLNFFFVFTFVRIFVFYGHFDEYLQGSGHPAPPRTLTNHFPKSNLRCF